MSRSLSAKKLTALLLFLVLCVGVPLAAFITHTEHPAHAASTLPYHANADGPYHVSGNQIIGADGKQYIFHGMGRDGLEFECTGDPFLDSAHLALMGPGTSGPGATYWYGNTVRLPLSEGIWLNGDANAKCTAAQYQALVQSVVTNLTNNLHLNVVLALMWTDAGGTDPGTGAGFDMADADSVTFWTQVAGIYKSNPNVLFELYNEPHPSTWACWAFACPISDSDTLKPKVFNYTGVGLQALVNAVRGAGATNVAIVAGFNWGYDLSQSQQAGNLITDSGNNLAYDTHPYSPYAGKTPADWPTSFGFLTATKPVMSLESGEYDCGNQYMGTLLNYFDAHQMSWTGWAWFSAGSVCGYPQAVSDWNGTPSLNMGLTELDQLLMYAGQPQATPPPNPSPSPTPIPSLGGPVSPVWYFPEGRAGGGFKEWLTLENPNSASCSATIAYLAQPDGKPIYSVTKQVTVPPSSRMTEWVDGDLGTSPNGPGISDAAQINVTNCPGIVAERPMYYNFQYTVTNTVTNSGSDVIGMTKLATTFYFGDLLQGNQPGGGSYASFITILNPVGGQLANVTANYYTNGKLAATQSVKVAGGSRGTIFPAGVAPARSVVVVTSDQPVAIERPTYFSNINGGQAGIVSGGADVVGVQKLSNDWLFAEGYTAQQFQENLVIANVDPVNKPATVNITLESSNGGAPATYTITVNPNSQVVWNVNAAQKNQALSAEVTSVGANILVEREMYFKYLHNANGRSLSSVGGSDVLGQIGPASANNYGFAEGYVNVGYDEWLTLQNPTAGPETINISIVNEAGGYYTTAVNVAAHSRYTVDITGMILSHLYRNGSGFQGLEDSMVVQSSGVFVAERPIYWNASDTQGGDDVLGYIGG